MHKNVKEWLRLTIVGYAVYWFGMLSVGGYFVFCLFTRREVAYFNALAGTMGMLLVMKYCLTYLFPPPDIPERE